MRRLLFVVLGLTLSGCAAALQMPPLSASHPASPHAEEAPLPPASPTLALPERGSGDASTRGEKKSAPAMDGAGHGGAHGNH